MYNQLSMIDRLKQNKVLFWTFEVLMIVLIVWILSQLDFIYVPIMRFIGAVFLPIMIAGFLYYLLNPLVDLIDRIEIKRFKMPRTLAVFIVMLLFILLFVFALMNFLPSLFNQVTNLIGNLPEYAQSLQDLVQQFLDSKFFDSWNIDIDTENLQDIVYSYSKNFLNVTASTVGAIISSITTITINIITIPVMLFYMLNDADRLTPFISSFFTKKRYANQFEELTTQLNKTLERYISGQVIEATLLAFAIFIGYSIIQQPYALLLAVIAGATNLIPYIGPWIGAFPAVLVALTISPRQAIETVIIILFVQMIDSNLIYPNIIGKSLQIHPLTIIVLLLAVGNVWGIGGIILAVPVYAVIKTIARYLLGLRKIRSQQLQIAEAKVTKNKSDGKKKK